MADIQVLPQSVADKIAAGEVAERPSAVVKELVENSIDAGADRITVEIKNGGIKYIRVEDNGRGIPKNQLERAFLRHATSKLRDIDDLYKISTMGFRGEALASICAVADVEVLSKTQDAEEGAYLAVRHGKPAEKEDAICNCGTTMIVQNLFAAVPARMKFMKKDATEAGYISDVLGRIALSRPDIAFSYICDGKDVFATIGDGKLINAVLKIYGMDYAKGSVELSYEEHGVKITGIVGKPELSRGNRTRQTLFVNGRYIKNHIVSKVVEEAYRNAIMVGRFPFFVLNIELSPELVDVNVHPAKTEIKFANEKEVYDIVYKAVKNVVYARESREKQTVRQETAAAKLPDIPPMREETGTYVRTDKPVPPSGGFLGVFERTEPDRRTIEDFMRYTVPKQSEPLNFNSPPPEAVLREKMTSAENTEELAAEPMLGYTDITDTAPEIKIIGQVFDTYVLFEQGENMYMIDQHAAHERRRFETLKNDYKSRKICGQILLVPIVLDVDSAELQIIRDNGAKFADLGFVIDEFGAGSVLIRETPLLTDEEEIKSLVLEIVSILRDGRPSAMLDFEEKALDMISCKYAIKANKKLSDEEIRALVEDVARLESEGITTCPHGRPIKVEFTKKSIEKLFKRIV